MTLMLLCLQNYLSALDEIGWSQDRFVDGCGTATVEIQAAFNSVQVRDFFATMNGAKDSYVTLDQMCLLPGFIPMSFDEASDAYLTLKNSETWREGLFPFLTDHMGAYYAVDCAENSDTCRSIFVCEKGFYPSCQFPDLCSVFDVYRIAVKRGLVFLEDEKFLEVVDEAFFELCRTKFPTIPFWSTA